MKKKIGIFAILLLVLPFGLAQAEPHVGKNFVNLGKDSLGVERTLPFNAIQRWGAPVDKTISFYALVSQFLSGADVGRYDVRFDTPKEASDFLDAFQKAFEAWGR